MGKISKVLVFALAIVALSATTAHAQHFQSGEPTCSTSGTTVTCTGSDIAGLGNDNVRAELIAEYSGTITCTNPGGNVVEAHETTFDRERSTGELRSKNGRVLVPQTSVSGPTELTRDEERTFCPNPQWDANLTDVQLESFTYTIYTVDRRTGDTVFFTTSGPE